MNYQVITADIVDSEQLSPEVFSKIREIIAHIEQLSAGKYEYFIRGDSIQIVLQTNALREVILLKTVLQFSLGVKIRASIGIGRINGLSERLSDSNGEAFTLSGRGLDLMKKESKYLTINVLDDDVKAEWQIHAAVLDYFEASQTANQAIVIYWLLQNKTQVEIAEIAGISQPSVNKRIHSSGWKIIQQILQRYNTVF